MNINDHKRKLQLCSSRLKSAILIMEAATDAIAQSYVTPEIEDLGRRLGLAMDTVERLSRKFEAASIDLRGNPEAIS